MLAGKELKSEVVKSEYAAILKKVVVRI